MLSDNKIVELSEHGFVLCIDGTRLDGNMEGLLNEGIEECVQSGIRYTKATFRYPSKDLIIESHLIQYEQTMLVEKWITITNSGSENVTIKRIDSFHLRLPQGTWDLMYYQSDWGAEFEPVVKALVDDHVILETRQGRSSKDMHPWMTLFHQSGDLLTLSPMWSGNWIIRCEKEESGTYTVSGGLSDWQFSKTLSPGESMEGVHAAMALGSNGDLNSTSIPFARIGRQHWYPRNELSCSLPTEWNHWWSYEDKTINEQIFRENAKEAARMGMGICTLDAGWFGHADSGTEWYEYRGDWEKVNAARFPGGIRELSDYVHGLGMKFGLWCEIEAVGKSSDILLQHPDFEARREVESLGYFCFGNPDVREWAYHTLDRLITEYRCDWIKLDFNLDPQAGCSRTDHGHGAGDGLYEHYIGYYSVLDRIRAKHPDVILENCASGGLRIDLGMMRHTHLTFLSDPDWPEHSLQVFWGASTMLATDACLHWSYSEWLGSHPSQLFHPGDSEVTQHQFDYYTRIAMLHGFGLSQKLPELPEWMKQRLIFHIKQYDDSIRPFIRKADFYRLSGQPLRGGRGDRWAVFQYAMPCHKDHLLFVFRLDGSEEMRSVRMLGLQPEAHYQLIWLSEEKSEERTGKQLLEDGLSFNELKKEDSSLIRIRQIEI